MIDLIITHPAEGPATLFTRNFRVHAGIPIGLYEEGPRSPVLLLYGDVSEASIKHLSGHYRAIIAIPFMENDDIPERPASYETMTVRAPILATIQHFEREGFNSFVKTFEGGPLVLKGMAGESLVLLFTADLIKATIRVLSGELEKHGETDGIGRPVPPPDSITYAPAVSFHFNLIENAIRYMFRRLGQPLLSIPRWPGSAPLAVFLSHDVDVVRKWTYKRTAYELLLGLKALLGLNADHFRKTLSSIAEAMKGRDPYWLFDELLFMENGSGFKSTWFFAPYGREYNERKRDFDPVYHRKPAEISAMIRRLIDNGCEVGLHGTRNAHFDSVSLRRQLDFYESRLGQRLRGVRQHYLMFSHGRTFEAAAESRLLYDSTLGFNDKAGFRNGMASPFFPFSSKHVAGSLVEIPLVFMDTCFIHRDEDPEAVMRHVTEAYLYARAAGGMFSSLVHPGNMDQMEVPALNSFYHSLLARFRMDHARSMTGTEIALWWRQREAVLKNLELGEGMWRIRGVELPEDMELQISAKNIASLRFAIEGATGASKIEHDILTIRPDDVDPGAGIVIRQKK